MKKTSSEDTSVNETIFKHWKLSTDIDNVLWLSIDREGESANSLSLEVLSELESIVNGLETNAPAGLVLQSGKPGTFIVGADVREFDDYDDAGVASDGIKQVHRLFNRIEALPFPKVVIIDGFCLGGGVELALTFDYRIASNYTAWFSGNTTGYLPGFWRQRTQRTTDGRIQRHANHAEQPQPAAKGGTGNGAC